VNGWINFLSNHLLTVLMHALRSPPWDQELLNCSIFSHTYIVSRIHLLFLSLEGTELRRKALPNLPSQSQPAY
jgi:hypothetical protein